jgi:superfamily I DNA/RNA helicase
MTLVSMTFMFEEALEGRYAVGQFNLNISRKSSSRLWRRRKAPLFKGLAKPTFGIWEAEKCRLLHVAITRAKDELLISSPSLFSGESIHGPGIPVNRDGGSGGSSEPSIPDRTRDGRLR